MLRALVAATLASLAFAAPASASEWAHPVNIVPIRAQPDAGAKRVTTTRMLTEDKLPEVYLVLERADNWVKIRVPGRPNGRTGWVRRDALGPIRTVTTRITVNRSTLTLTLTKRGRTILKTRVGVGTAATPTPAGHFWVREKLRFDNAPVYGTHALGTAAYAKVSDWPGGGVVGIHGTNQPQLIPGRPSHGCIRVKNADMAPPLPPHADRHPDHDSLTARSGHLDSEGEPSGRVFADQDPALAHDRQRERLVARVVEEHDHRVLVVALDDALAPLPVRRRVRRRRTGRRTAARARGRPRSCRSCRTAARTARRSRRG